MLKNKDFMVTHWFQDPDVFKQEGGFWLADRYFKK